ncbi:glycosyltransferase family A protein [Variovorax rhizosphaerae]|uniref:Glycosyltransferase family A protein n=1 Tax=Variovorax rhizosphaerae TaxID=1836200 RepID=A0ABU8WNB3_9BURK
MADAQRTPLVSFHVPVYNGAAYLREALDSISAQTFDDWECLLIDDCSTDGSPGILQDACRDARFRVVRQPANLNVANASNLAIRLARGKYLARLDQDDVAEPTRLAEQVAFMESHPEVDVCGGALLYFGLQNGLVSLPADDGTIKANLLTGMNNIGNPASTVRMDFLRQHSIVNDPRFPLSCDYGMWVDCTLAGGHFANLPGVMTRYRTHAGQASVDMVALQVGVISAKTRLLLTWFPDLSFAEVQAMEPLLRGNAVVFLDRESATRGVVALRKAMGSPRPSVSGENRAAVEAYLAQRCAIWQGHLDEA